MNRDEDPDITELVELISNLELQLRRARSQLEERGGRRRLLQVGNLAFINNALGRSHVFGRQATRADRACKVVGVDQGPQGRIQVETFNGYRTWRLLKNLSPLARATAVEIREEAIRPDRVSL